MKKVLIALVALCSACLVFSSYVSAQSSDKRLCVQDANRTYRDALADLRKDLNVNLAICRYGADVAACYSAAYTDLKACLQPSVESLESCRRSCGATLQAAREAAKTQLNCKPNCGSNSEYQKAVIRARIAFYGCKNSCRNDESVIAARAACRTVYATATKACRQN